MINIRFQDRLRHGNFVCLRGRPKRIERNFSWSDEEDLHSASTASCEEGENQFPQVFLAGPILTFKIRAPSLLNEKLLLSAASPL